MSLKTDIESLLFAVGRRATVEEIARYLRIRDQQKIIDALAELKADYAAKAGSIVIIDEDGTWKMTVRDDLLPIVRKVVSKTELPKGVMETLAIIAFKAPVLQSDIVKVRTNKAYDHLSLLESTHYITREKKGRTKLIKLAAKFFDYFDVPEGELKAKFSNVAALQQAITEKEQEIETAENRRDEAQTVHKAQEDQYKKELEEKHRLIDEEIAKLPEIDLIDTEGNKEKLETYESTVYTPPATPVLGKGIEILDEPEIFKIPKEAAQQPAAPTQPENQPATETAPEDKAEQLREELEPAETMEEAEEDVAPPEGTSKFDPESVEYQARKVAKGLASREGKGLYSEGMSAEIQQEVDEKVSILTGEHAEHKEDAEDKEHMHEEIEPEAATDVHVTPEEGEKAEREKGGPDPHAHPGKEE